MNIGKTLSAFAMAGVLVAFSAAARAYDSVNIVEVPVVSATPVYDIVKVNRPRQECWEEAVPVASSKSNSKTPEIMGAIVGAGVGRLFGSGRGQDAATVAGAVLGGSIGRDYKNNKAGYSNEVVYQQRCRVVDDYRTEERLKWYDVTYEYNGQLYDGRTSHDPGNSIRISVTIAPVE